MLYEVITPHDRPGSAAVRIRHRAQALAAVDIMPPNVPECVTSIGTGQSTSLSLGLSLLDSYISVAQASGKRYVSDNGTGEDSENPVPDRSRITSYNVCYTKLLRFRDRLGGGKESGPETCDRKDRFRDLAFHMHTYNSGQTRPFYAVILGSKRDWNKFRRTRSYNFV